MIYTFYSYKGGVGRSMALANVAEWLYQQGLRVIMIDWDLEAPGLENFFYTQPAELDVVRSQLGLIDLLLAYKRAFPRLQLAAREAKAQREEGITDDENFLLTLRESKHLAPVADALYPIHPPDNSNEKRSALWLMPAGWRSGDRFPVYAHAVQGFDWADFYNSYEGEIYFNCMREQLASEALADVVLIDSRTGVTEMGGVCTRQMADVVVSFCVPNAQNLGGVATMAESFKRSEIISKRGRELEVMIVPTRIDNSELDLRKAFEDQFRQQLDKFTPSSFSLVKSEFWKLQIPYIAKYAYSEKKAINDPSAPELSKAYKEIAAHLALLAQGKTGLQIRAMMAEELRLEFGDRLPSVFISASGAEGELIAKRLRAQLSDKIALWPDLADTKGAGDLWQRTVEILDQARAMVLIITQEALDSDLTRRQWRYARQRGVNVYLVTTNWNDTTIPMDEVSSSQPDGSVVLPSWLRSADYYTEFEWEKLASILQRPLPVTRVPFMAPDLIEGYVGRPQLLNDLKEAVLTNSAKRVGQSSTVAICGPAGCGKTTAAIAICQDDAVDTFFEDGIMWVTLGEKPNLLAELAKLYSALTGERPPFFDEEEAARAVASKLSGKRYLLVIKDVVKAEHLLSFAFAARDSNCVRLITTRDLNIAFGSDARVIQIGAMTDAESLQLLAAGLDVNRDVQQDVEDLAKRLDHWPLAMRLANAQLKKRAVLRHDLGAGVKSLLTDYDARGVSVLDTSSDGKGLISEKLAAALQQALPLKEDYDHFLQLAFFPANAVITVRDVSDLWGLDVSETEKHLQQLRDVSLLDYDAVGKTVRLQSVVRSYILSRMPDQDQLDDKLEAAFAHFSPAQQEAARSVLTRLVRLTSQNEDGDDTRQRVKIDELAQWSRIAVDLLAEAKLVAVEKDPAGKTSTLQIANEAYLKGWKRLHHWIRDDREFLLWRQQLKLKIAEWEETKRDQGALLSGVPLEVASGWRDRRADDLNDSEKTYIDESRHESDRLRQTQAQVQLQTVQARRRGWITTLTTIVLLLGSIAGVVLYVHQQNKHARELQAAEDARKARELAVSKDKDGMVEFLAGQYDKAIQNFSAAIQAKPDFSDAYLHRGNAYAAGDSPDKIKRALDDYNEAINRDPANYEAYFQRGVLYDTNNPNPDPNAAISDFSHVIGLKPDYWSAYLYRGYAYEDAKNPDAAAADYTQVINSPADQNNQIQPLAYLRRGVVYYDKKDKDHAASDLLRAIAATTDPDTRDTASKYLKSLGFTGQEGQTAPSPNIFLQYIDARDGTVVDSIGAALRSNGFKVQPKELIVRQTAGEVRYYSKLPEILALVNKIKKIVNQTLASKSSVKLNVNLAYLGKRYPYVPPGTIEVWIPQLQPAIQPLPRQNLGLIGPTKK